MSCEEDRMERIKPELFNEPTQVTCKRGECVKGIDIEISPDGAYNGNGEFQDPMGRNFKIIGFEKREDGTHVWIGRGFIIDQHP